MEPTQSNRRFITPLVIILLIVIVLAALAYLLLQKPPSPSTPTALCSEQPQGSEGGVFRYPVNPKWKQLTILGQLFTAADCGSSRLSQVPGVQNGTYQPGVAVWTKTTPSSQLVTTLQTIGFTCGDNTSDATCQQWNLDKPVLVTDLQKLEPYTDELKFDQCIRCQQ